ncbi:MAG: GNAT family N-acetyltransferase [Candidatus Hodarchaeales archaeon]
MLTFRKATIDDLDDLIILRIELFREMRGELREKLKKEFEKSLRRYLPSALSTGDFIAWIAQDNDRTVAISGLIFCNKPPSDNNLSGREAYILNMYTLPMYRKQGIALKLLDNLITVAREAGIKLIRLHTTEIGKGVYKQAGFAELNTEMVLFTGENE